MNDEPGTPESRLNEVWDEFRFQPLRRSWGPVMTALSRYFADRVWWFVILVVLASFAVFVVWYLKADAATTRQIIVGSLAAIAGLFAAGVNAAYTLRRARAVESQVSLEREQRLRELGSSRFKHAIDQLGDSERLHVRLGGIYSLTAVARDDPHNYFQPVYEILSAFVRTYRRPNAPEAPEAGEPAPEEPASLFSPPEDILTALIQIGRRDLRFERGIDPSFRPDLNRVDFRNWNLEGISLPRVSLEFAHLEEANLDESNLEGAIIKLADLERTSLVQAILNRASLEVTNLVGAKLQGIRLLGANLEYATLKNAILMNASLEGARMCGASIKGASLDGTCLKNVDFSKVVPGMTLGQLQEAEIHTSFIPPKYLQTEWEAWKAEQITRGNWDPYEPEMEIAHPPQQPSPSAEPTPPADPPPPPVAGGLPSGDVPTVPDGEDMPEAQQEEE